MERRDALQRGGALERERGGRERGRGADESLGDRLVHVVVEELRVASNQVGVGEAVPRQRGSARIYKPGELGVLGIAVGSANEIGNDGDAALFGSREEEWVGATIEKEVCNAQTADGAGEKERGIAVSRAEIGVHVVDAEQRHDLEVVQLDGEMHRVESVLVPETQIRAAIH